MLFGSTISKLAVSGALLAAPLVAAVNYNGSIADVSPLPPIAGPHETDALLVATLADGNIETQWLPRRVCEQITSELRAKAVVTSLRSDGTRLQIAQANCSLRNAQLSADYLFSE